MRRFILAAAMALAALRIAPAAAEAAHGWRHGVIDPKNDAGFLLMVQEGGFAARHGLALEIVPLQSDALLLKALVAGELDSYEGGPGSAIVAAARGADVRIVGCHWPGLPHGLFVAAALASPADLKGRSIAISAPGALPDLLARGVLARFGIAAGDVRFVSLGSDPDRFKALAAHVVDVAVVSGEYQPIAAAQGLKLLIAGRDVMPDYVRLCLVTSGDRVAAHGDDLAAFLAAEIEALRHAVADREAALALTRRIARTGPDDPRPAFVYDDAVRTGAVDPEIALPINKLRWMQDQLVATGSLPRPGDLARAVDPGPRTRALALAGR